MRRGTCFIEVLLRIGVPSGPFLVCRTGDVDGVAEVGGWDEHVLAGVVAADGGGAPPPGVGHRQSVVPTVRRPGSVSGGNRGGKS